MQEEKILLVDDEEDFINTLSERMRLRDIHVLTAYSGKEAIKLVKKNRFDAVILDMMMPDIDGLETLQRMLKIDKTLQIIMLTGRATVGKSVEAMKLGATDFLEKPVELDRLVELIKAAKIKMLVIREKQSEEDALKIMKRKGW